MSHHFGMLARIAAIVSFALMYGPHVYGQRPGTDNRNASPLRQNAIVLLDSTIDEVKAVEDVETRVTFAADISRLFGSVKPERCRQMLDSLFDDLMKLKNAKSSQTNINSQRPSSDALLQKVIQAAASFDRKLARNYIDRYTGEAPGQKGEPATPAQSLSQQADLNMLLALQLIETDPALAVRVAQNAVAVAVTVRTLEFLGTLRKKDAGLANAFFPTALQSVIARRGTDINELLLLYTYVFSPTRVLWLNSQGIVLRQIPGYQRVAQDYPVDFRLAHQFLQASAQILLTDPQYRQGNLSTGTAGDLYFINLIKPHVANFAPKLLRALSEQADLLVIYLQPEQYARLQLDLEHLGKAQNGTRQGTANAASDVESLLSRAEALPPSSKRDYLYYMAAMSAVRKKQYDTASDIVEHVSAESRAKVKEFIGFSIAQQSISDHQFERAEQWAIRDADLTRRAYLFAMIASALLDDESKDYARATTLLNEVERLASKLDATQERISLLLHEAEIYSRFDIPRASEVLRLACKAANGSEGFTGDSKVSRRLEIGDFGFFYEMFNDNLSLSRTLSRLAFSDFFGTLSTVRELQNRAFRIRAVISLCGGVLTRERPSRPGESRAVAGEVL